MGKGGRFFVNPRSCARICCINGNAVFIGNDVRLSLPSPLPFPSDLASSPLSKLEFRQEHRADGAWAEHLSTNPALHYMEGYVGNIIDHCSFTTIAGQLAGGQMFDTGRYNVILRGGQGLATDCAYGPWKQ